MGADLKPLDGDLPQPAAELAQTLRTLFEGLGVSLTRYSARVHLDKSAVSRYFSGDRIPRWAFVNALLVESTIHHDGAPPTGEVVAYLRRLHRAALEAGGSPARQVQLLQDKLGDADREVARAVSREHELEKALQAAQRRIAELRVRERELEAERDEERDAHDAELAGLLDNLDRQRTAHAELLQEIARLQSELHTAHQRRIAAEERCEELERQLDTAAATQDDDVLYPDLLPELELGRAAVEDAYAFEHSFSLLANTFVQAEAQRLDMLLHQLQVGEGTYDGEDRDWLLTLARSCARTLDAASVTMTDAGGRLRFRGEFWESDLGLHYLELQADAVARGVAIRRVFILENAKVTEDAAYQEMCERQSRLGIDVRYLTPDMASVDLLGKLDDFTLFDNEISYESGASLALGDGARPVFSSTHLVLNRNLVAKRVRQFAEIWDAALPCVESDEDYN